MPGKVLMANANIGLAGTTAELGAQHEIKSKYLEL